MLPETAPEAFARRIRATVAEVVAGGSYDEAVAEVIRLAESNGWLHLADGSWPGYEERPVMVVEGFTVLAQECRAEFESARHLEIGDGADSNMGRLDCKNASLIAFEALQCAANVFLIITDEDAEHAVALLAIHDMATIPGGSAGLAELIVLALGEEASVLVIVSEGAEDV